MFGVFDVSLVKGTISTNHMLLKSVNIVCIRTAANRDDSVDRRNGTVDAICEHAHLKPECCLCTIRTTKPNKDTDKRKTKKKMENVYKTDPPDDF